MLINPIASGSSGNAYYISDGQSNLLLDAGIPLAQIQAGCGYKVSQLSGCLVTHGHGDHVKAAKALARMGVNIYTSQGTADMANLTGHRICTVRALESFHAGTFEVLPFDVEHDVPEPLGFLIRSTVTGEKVLYFTDTVYIKYTFIGLRIMTTPKRALIRTKVIRCSTGTASRFIRWQHSSRTRCALKLRT